VFGLGFVWLLLLLLLLLLSLFLLFDRMTKPIAVPVFQHQSWH
jgi:hypothetical protein